MFYSLHITHCTKQTTLGLWFSVKSVGKNGMAYLL